MQFLDSQIDLSTCDIVEVEIDRPANVRLMDSTNFASFRTGRRFRSWGGGYTGGIVRLPAPMPGHFHLVIDLGARGGTINHSVRVLQR
jgi:hypothetical protein